MSNKRPWARLADRTSAFIIRDSVSDQFRLSLASPDVLVIVIGFLCRLQLRLRVSISKLKSDLGVTDDIQEFTGDTERLKPISVSSPAYSVCRRFCLASPSSSVLGTDYQLIGFQMETNRVRPFVCHQSNSRSADSRSPLSNCD